MHRPAPDLRSAPRFYRRAEGEVVKGKTRARAGLSLPQIADQFVADLALRCVPQTVRDARTCLSRVLRETGWQTVGDVDRIEFDDWRRARIAGGMSNRTVNRHTVALRAALALALNLRQIEYDPLAGLRALSTKGRNRKRVARALRDPEIDTLLRAASAIDARHPKRFPREPLLRALLQTGCRWGELVACLWADIDPEHGTLRLRAETTKTSEERKIPLDPDLLERILALRHDHVRVRGELPTEADRIFLSPHGRPWSKCPTNYHRFLSEAMRVARIPK